MRKQRVSPAGIIPESMRHEDNLEKLMAFLEPTDYSLLGREAINKRPRIKKVRINRVWVGSSTVGSEFERIRAERLETGRIKEAEEMTALEKQIRMMF